MAVQLAQGQTATARLRQSLEQWETLSAAAAAPGASNSVHLEQQAYEVYIAGQFRSTITNHEAWNDLSGALIPRERRKMAEEWVVNRPPPTAAELEQAAKWKGEEGMERGGTKVKEIEIYRER
jgi:hypothetical protein